MRTRLSIEQQMELYAQPDKAALYPVAVMRAILETLLDIRDALTKPEPVVITTHPMSDSERAEWVRRYQDLVHTLPPLDADRQKGRYE